MNREAAYSLTEGLQAPIVKFAVKIVTDAAVMARDAHNSGEVGVDYKSDGSPVTEIDQAIERRLREAIAQSCPGDTIVGEEYPETNSNDAAQNNTGAKYTWYIDPIDGTVAFIHRIPLYCTLLALYRNGEPLIGIIHNPVLQETLVGIAGRGTYYNGARVQMPGTAGEGQRSPDKLRLLYSDAVYLEAECPGLLAAVTPHCSLARTWCDAYGFILLATNRADVIIDSGLKPWDIAPLYPIINEAGGYISNFSGTRAPLDGSVLACRNGIEQKILYIIRNTDRHGLH